MQDTVSKELSRMMAACSRRECCRSEIRAKLGRVSASKGNVVQLTASQIEEIVERLCGERFIDERRYASAFARDRSSLQGWGPVRIRRALSLKGISPEDVSFALESIDSKVADARMESLLTAKLRSLRSGHVSDSQALRVKLLRYGLSRGYSYDRIAEFLSSFIDDK